MTWNYRLLAHKNNDEIYFKIHEVYYENGNPISCTKNPVDIGGENIDEIRDFLNKINDSLNKPILWYGEKFPKEFS